MKYTIVIPCYNEEKNIPILVEKFNHTLNNINNIKILLVNNGSNDGTKEVIESIKKKYSFIESLNINKNQGYGFGIIQGLNNSKTEYIGWTHADLQCDPDDILKGIQLIEKENSKNCYVKGRRKNRPFLDNIFTFGMSIFETLYFKKKLFDINAQPNIFPRDFYLEWENPPFDFSLDLFSLYLAKIKGLRVIRFNVLFPDRIHGHSKWNFGLKSKIKFIIRTLKFSINLKKRIKSSN